MALWALGGLCNPEWLRERGGKGEGEGEGEGEGFGWSGWRERLEGYGMVWDGVNG